MEYLEQKGHFPVKNLIGGRLSYLCPMPWHSESKPSFIVYTNADYENFYCFGCNAKHNIIHLVSFLDNITRRQAIEKLSDGVEFSIIDEEKLAQEQMINIVDHQQPDKSPLNDIAMALLDISSCCRWFLKNVNNEKNELTKIDKVWEIVDASLRDYDFERIEKIHEEISSVLLMETNKFKYRQEQNIRKHYKHKT